MSLVIVCLLIISTPVSAYADSVPGTISVSGGSIGSGGVEGNSNVLKGTALTVIMATLASAGVTVKLAAEDYANGNTAINYLEDKFAEWDSKTDDAWNEYEKYRALNETKVGSDGSLYIPEAASALMQKFVNWLYANDDVALLPQEGDSEQITINGTWAGTQYIYQDGYRMDEFSSTVAVVQVFSGSNYQRVAYAPTRFSYRTYRKASNGDWTYDYVQGSSYRNDYGYYDTGTPYTSSTPFDGLEIVTGLATYYQSLNGQFVEDNNAPVIDTTGLYGETLDIPQLVDESGNGKILIVQPGLIGSVQDSYVGSNNATIGIQDYLDALKDLYGQQAIPQDITDLPDIAIPGEDAITGTKEEVAVIDRDVVLAPDITVPADPGAITWPEVPEIAVPVADPSDPADPDVSIPAMSLDLTEYFPFCLPFDIYNILQKLNADPVTPEITVDWGNILGQFGIEYEMHLDLHDYDDLAALLRNMETAAFVVGLAVVTRQMFLRG